MKISTAITFNRGFLQDILSGDTDEEYKIISDKITDVSRWSVSHYLIFEYGGKIYGVGYSAGATEMQDERPFENDPEDVEVDELKMVKVLVEKYVPINYEGGTA